jgi:hypothetical protein
MNRVGSMKERGGIVLMVVGLVIVLIGGVGWALSGDDSGDEMAGSTTTTGATTTSLASTTTAGDATTTTVAPSTTSSTSSTTSSSTTSSSIPDEPETVEDFVADFSQALEDGDREFVLERLHPVVIDGWGPDLCESWVDSEIMTLSNYTLVSVNEGPVTRTVDTPAGAEQVENFFDTSVTFTFQGQNFDAAGSFALIGTDMYWLGQCR